MNLCQGSRPCRAAAPTGGAAAPRRRPALALLAGALALLASALSFSPAWAILPPSDLDLIANRRSGPLGNVSARDTTWTDSTTSPTSTTSAGTLKVVLTNRQSVEFAGYSTVCPDNGNFSGTYNRSGCTTATSIDSSATDMGFVSFELELSGATKAVPLYYVILQYTSKTGPTTQGYVEFVYDTGLEKVIPGQPERTAPTLISIERSDPTAEVGPAENLHFRVTFSEEVYAVNPADFAFSGGVGSIKQVRQRDTADTRSIAVHRPSSVWRVTIAGRELAESNAIVELSLAMLPTIADAAGANPLTSTTATGTVETYTLVNMPLALDDPADLTWKAGTRISPVWLPQATGGFTPYEYSLIGTLPEGIKWQPDMRRLSGTPAAAQEAVDMTWKVKDARETELEQTFTITVELGPGVTLSTTSLDVPEGGEATYTVVLNTQPAADVEVRLVRRGQDGDIRVSPDRLTFTTANWDTAQTVTVRALVDDDVDNGSVDFLHRTRSTGDPDYEGVDSLTITVTEQDAGDVSPPTATLTAPAYHDGSAAFDVTVAFSEDVTDFDDAGDVHITGGSLTGGANGITSTDAQNYTLNITPSGTNDVTVRVRANAVQDGAGNANAASADKTVPYGVPGVTVSTTALTVGEGMTATYTVVLNTEPSADVTVAAAVTGDADVTVAPASVSIKATNWNKAETFTVSAADDADAADGTATIAHTTTSTDTDYNGVTVASVAVTEDDDDTADTTAPTVTKVERHDGTNAQDEHTNADSVAFRVTFSEDVVNVDTADFAASGTTATASAAAVVSGNDTQYIVTVSGGDLAGFGGTVGLTFATGQNIADAAGNALTATLPTGTNYETYDLDNTAPTVTSVERHDGTNAQAEDTNADSVTFLVTFSEDVENVSTDGSDFAVSGTTATAAVAAVTGNAAQYIVTLSGGNLAGLNDTVGLGFATGQDIADPAGNALTATLPTGTNYETYDLDNTAPTVTLTAPANHDGSAAFNVTVAFSEDVSDFDDAADVTVTGGTLTGGANGITSTDARTYTVNITPTTGSTSAVTVQVPADAAADDAGNGNTASASETVAYSAPQRRRR